MSGKGYHPENFQYCMPDYLVEQLDYLVKDPEDKDYLILKRRLYEAAERSVERNPFGAGRPERFDEQDKKEMLAMKESGMTYRQIAQEYDCSPSIVYKAIAQLKYGWK